MVCRWDCRSCRPLSVRTAVKRMRLRRNVRDAQEQALIAFWAGIRDDTRADRP